MQSIKVGELMVPVAEYAAVSEKATLYDAVLALEEADKTQQEHQKYAYVLVLDKNQRVVGKRPSGACSWRLSPATSG